MLHLYPFHLMIQLWLFPALFLMRVRFLRIIFLIVLVMLISIVIQGWWSNGIMLLLFWTMGLQRLVMTKRLDGVKRQVDDSECVLI